MFDVRCSFFASLSPPPDCSAPKRSPRSPLLASTSPTSSSCPWAATPATAGKGVLHAMNQNINAARDVQMTSAYRVQPFPSVDLGVMAVADPDTVKFYSEPTRRHTFKSEFTIATLPEKLPAVEIA